MLRHCPKCRGGWFHRS
ncbi:hypothetical protein [Sphingorhabdus sp.]